MSQNANQYHIVIKKQEKYDTRFYYAERAATLEACKSLNNSALKLYFYFLVNANEFQFDLYKDNVEKELGIKKTAYHEAINILKDRGYLVYKGKQGFNYVYEFYERPTSTGIADSD